MKAKKNDFLIDTYIRKYQNLSQNEKLSTNLSIVILLVILSIGAIYNTGKALGEFLFYFNN
jgi:hypothetical protein